MQTDDRAVSAYLKTASLRSLVETRKEIMGFTEAMFLNEYQLSVSKRMNAFLDEIDGEFSRRVMEGLLVEAPTKEQRT